MLLAVAGSASSATTQEIVWSWQGTDARGDPARIAFERYESDGQLFVWDTSAKVACSVGQPQELYVALNGRTGIPVQPDGTFAYNGPTDGSSTDPRHPTMQVSGRMAGATITGAFRLAGDVIPAEGEPRCHAESALIAFTAHCEGICPEPVKEQTPTAFPGVGIGGPGLRMRSVAKLGMTIGQVRALHRSRPYFAQLPRCRRGSRSRCGSLGFKYAFESAHARYLFLPRLTRIELWDGIKTAAGVAPRSTREQLVRAYPRIRCGREKSSVRACFMLRGTAARGVLTEFVLIFDRVAAFVLMDCGSAPTVCSQVVRS